jgi:predicted nucleotidyltransferase component of viral defense system
MTMELHPIIAERLTRSKRAADKQQLEVAREVVQELALLGLERAGFFKRAAFHGGTALRILYGLSRFSEDLDFCLHVPDTRYKLSSFLDPMCAEMRAWGLQVEALERNRADPIVRKAFLKESSLGGQLNLQLPLPRSQKFHVKLELDTNPPAGAGLENKICEFPLDYYLVCHNLPSLFAGKLHALLFRPYLKGRDWFDLIFYFTRRAKVNLLLLRNAIVQSHPQLAATLPDPLSMYWLQEELQKRIDTLDFVSLKNDVLPFVEDVNSISLWSRSYFTEKLEIYFAAEASSGTLALK